jgi:hypothetical protein
MSKKVNFGSSIKAEGGVMKQPQFAPPPLTTEQKIDNITNNTANTFNQHAEALNAIAFWIAEQDPAVKEAGNVTAWTLQVMKERQELEERKANYDLKKNRTKG